MKCELELETVVNERVLGKVSLGYTMRYKHHRRSTSVVISSETRVKHRLEVRCEGEKCWLRQFM